MNKDKYLIPPHKDKSVLTCSLYNNCENLSIGNKELKYQKGKCIIFPGVGFNKDLALRHYVEKNEKETNDRITILGVITRINNKKYISKRKENESI